MVRNGADRPAISTGPALMIPAGYPRDLPSALLRAARDFGTSGVVEIGPDGRETRLDFPTLLELAARILAGLRANGVRAGDPAVVHCTEPVGFFAAFWACTLGGIRPLLISPAAGGDRTEAGRERLRQVTDLLGWTVLIGRPSDLPDDLGLPVLDPDALAGHEPTSEFHRPAADDVAVLMMSSGSSTGTPKIIQLTHRGLVEFAAGTPAMLPVRPGQTTLNWLPLDHSGAFLLYHLLPVFAGCTNIHVATDWVLANPLRWLDLMDAHRVNHSWSPNFGYRLATAAIAGEPDRHWDLSALRSLVSGGEQITVPVVSEFLRLTNRFGVVPETFVAAWGMTETVTGITFARPGLTPNVHRVRIPPTGVVEWVDQRTTAGKVAVARPGKSRVEAPGVLSLVSVGTPAPGATVRIVGSNGAVLPEGRIGQLQIASARVTPGYLGNPDADRAAFPAGNWPARKWLSTGDQAFITGGQVVITGRDSERIILNGQNYYAHDIETVAATAPGTTPGLIAACGLPDPTTGTERLLIFHATPEPGLGAAPGRGAADGLGAAPAQPAADGLWTAGPGTAPTQPAADGLGAAVGLADNASAAANDSAVVGEAIRAALRERLALTAQVVAVPRRHFPTTPGGKILRPLLKQRFIDGSLNAPTSPYGEPLRPNTPYAAPSARGSFDEDPAEQTTELPVVRLAWRRTLADSIPTPPSRPTLGANRHPNPLDPHPADAPTTPSEALTPDQPEPHPANAPTSEAVAPTPEPSGPDAPTAEQPDTQPADAPNSVTGERDRTQPAALTDALEAPTAHPIEAPAAGPRQDRPADSPSDPAEAYPDQLTTPTEAPQHAPTNDPSDEVTFNAGAFSHPSAPTSKTGETPSVSQPDDASTDPQPDKAAADPQPDEVAGATQPDEASADPQPDDAGADPQPDDAGAGSQRDAEAVTDSKPIEPALPVDANAPSDAAAAAAGTPSDAAAPGDADAPSDAVAPAPTDPQPEEASAEPQPDDAGAGPQPEAAGSQPDDALAAENSPVESAPPVGAYAPSDAAAAANSRPTEPALPVDAHATPADPEVPAHAEALSDAGAPSDTGTDAPSDAAAPADPAVPANAEAMSDPGAPSGADVDASSDAATPADPAVPANAEALLDAGAPSGADVDASSDATAPADPAVPANADGDADGGAPVGGEHEARVEGMAERAGGQVAVGEGRADVVANKALGQLGREGSGQGGGVERVVEAIAPETPEEAGLPSEGGQPSEPEQTDPASTEQESDAAESEALATDPAEAGEVESTEESTPVATAIQSQQRIDPATPALLTEPAGPSTPTHLADSAEDANSNNPARAAEAAISADVADVAERVRAAEAPGSAEVAEGNEQTRAATATESAGVVDGGDDVESAGAVDGGELAHAAQAAGADAAEGVFAAEAPGAAEVAEGNQQARTAGATESAGAVEGGELASTAVEAAGAVEDGGDEFAGAVGGGEGAESAGAVDGGEGAEAGAVEGREGAEGAGRAVSADAGVGERADAALAADVVDSRGSAGSGEGVESVEGSEAAESAAVAESAESAREGEDDGLEAAAGEGEDEGLEVAAGEGAEAADGVEAAEVVGTADMADGSERADRVESVEAGDDAEPNEGVAAADAAQAGEPAEGDETTELSAAAVGPERHDSAEPEQVAAAAAAGEPAESERIVAEAGEPVAAAAAVGAVAVGGVAGVGVEAPAAGGGAWLGRVVGVFRGVLGDEVDERTGLLELGVDSVAMVRVHSGLQGELGIEFPRAVMFEQESILALSNFLEARADEFRSTGAAHSNQQPPKGQQAPSEQPRSRGKGKKQAVEPIAIIGLAARFPGADTLEQFWENLAGGVESLRRSPAGSKTENAVSGVLDDVESFDAEFFGLSDREAELTDPAQRIFLEVCQHALEHGGHAGADGRIGIFAGSNVHTQQNDALATRVAYRLGLTGPAIGVQAAWSSSLVAIHLACQALRSGDADLALAGAAAVQVPQATGSHVTSESPTGHVRVFDAGADGTVGGNGVAAVLLKRLDQAVTDGDTVYAVIRGSAVSNESDQADLVERALEKAGVPAESLSYFEANATGTAAEDAREFNALTSVLRKHTDKVGFVTIGSVKPNIGHLDSAAGMAGLIKTVLMLQHRTLVPTINHTKIAPDLPIENSPFVFGTETRDWEASTPLRAGVSALDVGGTSAHVILEEAPRQIRRGDDGPVVLPLSAPDPDALTELVELFRADLEQGTGHRLIDLASTAALGRQAHRQRLAVAGSSEAELAEALGTAQAVAVPRGGPGPLGFAFTGQGAARRGMAAGLAARFPVFRSVLDECDKVYAEEFGGSLLELLLTPAGTAEGVWPTETAQPALFAFELALARLWQSFGVQPALVVGHSVGEYAALCVAGALSLADGVRLTAKRGELMQRGTVPGAMVAVRADADRVRELARTSGVEIAAGNGPQSFVLTGTEVIVGQLAEQLDRLEVSWQRLDVDRAFHSSLVDPILADFAEVVRQISLRPLRMPMVSSWSGELLESGTALDSDYLVGQLRQPVLFGDAVEALTAAGCRRFLELGPDAVLSPAGRRIAPNSTWIPAQRLGQDPVLATMNGLAELYEQGTEITWSKVYPNAGRVPLPVYPFRRVHHPVDTSAAAAPAPTEQPPSTTTRPAMRAEGPDPRTRPTLKRIPLDPPSSSPTTPSPEEPDDTEHSPFALPAENTHPIAPRPAELKAAPIPAGPAEHEPSDVSAATDSVGTAGDGEADAASAERPSVNSGDGASATDEQAVGAEVAPAGAVEATAAGEPNAGWNAEGEGTDASAGENAAESGDGGGGVAERYRESLGVVLDLTGEQLGLDPYDVTVDHTFAELGADSLSMLRVVEEVGQRFGVEVAVSELFEELDTPHKLASAVASRNGEVDPFDLLGPADPETTVVPESTPVKDSRTALAVLGSGLAELAAKVDAAAAATSEADLPGSGMAALMSQQLRVAGQLVDGVTKLMHEQLALLNETTQNTPAEKRIENKEQNKERNKEQNKAEEAAQEKLAADQKRRADLDFWHGVLAGAQPLVLPSDRPRPAARPEVGQVELNLDAGLGDAVFAFSRERRVSPLMTMLAAVGTVLGRFAAQDDITIGTAALRGAGEKHTPALPLRVDLSGEPDLGDLAQRIRETTIAAFDHATADLAVLEQDPLFQVLVEFEPGDEHLAPELDLRLRLAHHPGGIRCTADYRAGLFDQATVERLLHYLESVLRRAITDPRMSLPELMLPIEADRKLLNEFEGEPPPAGPIGRVRRNAVVAGELSGLHTLFEQQVARTPDAIAVIQGDRELTYAELNRRANAVAWQLVDLGIKPGQLVAVRVARGAELVVGVLAALKSGAAYLPLDPAMPESRWSFMIADSGAVALVGDDAALADRLGLRLVPVAAVDGDPRARQAPPVRAAADDVAYCIYTSGSTGNPKGVAVPHRGPVNLIRQYLRTRRSLRTLQWTSFGFDVHVQELFTALASGAALVVLGEDDRYDPDEVVAALTKYEVERLFMTFTPLTALLATMPEMPKLPALREIIVGGEAMVLTHGIKEFLAAHPECTLFNEYGPTEASVVTTIHQVDPDEDRPSIGRPIDGVVVRLLDEALRPVPVGAIGEIHLGGAAVAQGYLGRPDETEAAFVNDPAHPGGRLYRSRDLGRWRADGTLDYLGRVDDQVKIRGHRVEPGETEYVLADLDGVIDAVVVANTDPAGDTCLIGYVVLEDDDPAVLARLLLELTKELPIYLVPADLIPIEDLPLDASGKLDRSRLPDPEWLKP